MLVYPGKVSLYGFIAPLFSATFLLIPFVKFKFLEGDSLSVILSFALGYFICLSIFFSLTYKDFLNQVVSRAEFLGIVFSCGIYVVVLAPASYKVFGCYLMVLSFFHYSEFLGIALSNPLTLSVESYILDHSLDYKLAALASWIEFFIERYFYPELKMHWWISGLGLTLCVLCEALRKTAMVTAGGGFTHQVQSKRRSGHELITSGVYSWARHPSYVGWFYWAIGTQVILLNPLCLVLYTLASWKFFQGRILIEEMSLVSFFGAEYLEYQSKVPSGLPFISGYRAERSS